MKTPKPKAVENRMLRGIAAYLKTQGYEPVVISADRVEGPVSNHYYEFVVRFTGGKKEEEAADAL